MKAVVERALGNGFVLRILDTTFAGMRGYLPKSAAQGGFARDAAKGARANVSLDAGFDPILELPLLTQSEARLPSTADPSGESIVAVVESSSRNVIRLWTGNREIAANKNDYYSFLDSKGLPQELADHGILGVGDRVRGFLKSVTLEGRRVLSIRDYLEAGTDHEEAPNESPPERSRTSVERGVAVSGKRDLLVQVSPILLVEDDLSLRQTLSRILRIAGATCVLEAADAGGADERLVSYLETQSTDRLVTGASIAVVDSNLEGPAGGHDGLRLIANLKQIPGMKVLLITGEFDHSPKTAKWGNLAINGFLQKPFGMEEFLSALEQSLASQAIPLSDIIKNQDYHDAVGSGYISEAPSIDWTMESDSAAITRILRPGFSNMREGCVAVFEVHPRSFRSVCISCVGKPIRWEPHRGKIGKSVIKDTALAGNPLIDLEGIADNPRHLWTRQMISYRAFCGVPIVTDLRLSHAIVAFMDRSELVNTEFVLRLQRCAEGIGRILERSSLIAARASETKSSTIGMGLSALSHELGNNLSTMQGSADLVRTRLEQGRIHEVDDDLDRLLNEIDDAHSKVKALRGEFGSREPTCVLDRLAEAARRCRRYVREEISENVSKAFSPPGAVEADDGSLHVEAVPAALTMVFFNLYLNAAQQLHQMRRLGVPGRIWQTWEWFSDHENAAWFLVHIHDTGPGIHPDDLKRVFQPGFSTKPSGSGLGLFICRQLLADIKCDSRRASIAITRSEIWAGTTFTVALPSPNPGR